MRRITYTALCFTLLIVLSVFAASVTLAATATTSTSVYGYTPTKGYVVYAATITASSSGSTAVVSATTGKKVKVIGYSLSSVDVNSVKFLSAANDIDGSPLWYFAANTSLSVPVTTINNQPMVLMQTNAGEALNVSLSAAKAVSGSVLYIVE